MDTCDTVSSDDRFDAQLDEIIETHLRHLHEGTPPPDLEVLPAELVAEAEPLLRVLDLLVDAAPPAPPLHLDPVAIRLGLVPAPDPAAAARWLTERPAGAAAAHHAPAGRSNSLT